jgi:hypothetical protein
MTMKVTIQIPWTKILRSLIKPLGLVMVWSAMCRLYGVGLVLITLSTYVVF